MVAMAFVNTSVWSGAAMVGDWVSPDKEEPGFFFRGIVEDALLEEFWRDAKWHQMDGLLVFACL